MMVEQIKPVSKCLVLRDKYGNIVVPLGPLTKGQQVREDLRRELRQKLKRDRTTVKGDSE